MPSKLARRPRGSYIETKRIIIIYNRLFGGERLRQSRLVEEMGVTRRTIQRYFKVLRDVLEGSLDHDDKDGERVWSLRRERRTRDVNVEQLLAVLLGAELTRFLPGRFNQGVRTLLWLLSIDVPNAERKLNRWRSRVAVIAPGQKDYHRVRNGVDFEAHLLTLLTAMLREVRVTLEYLSPKRAREGLLRISRDVISCIGTT